MSIQRSGQLVAARYRDGRVFKGLTTDFLPTRNHFHVTADGEDQPRRVRSADLKALFFIMTQEGDPKHQERKTFELPSGSWIKVWIKFKCDGEELAGWTTSSLFSKIGFFMMPVDQDSNIDKLFVFRSALANVFKGSDAETAAREYARRKQTAGPPQPAGENAEVSPWLEERDVSSVIARLLEP